MELPMQRIAITGATGYIGGRLAPRLLGSGYAVRCLVRSPRKLEGREWTSDSRVEIRKAGLADSPSGGDPLWRDHDRQAVDEIAKNLERCRARTNDHSRAQDRERHSRRPERRLHVPARREMFTKAAARLSKTTEI